MLSEQAAAEGEVMRLVAVVLDADIDIGRGPGAGVDTFREAHRVSDQTAVVGPAGLELAVGEVVVTTGGLETGPADLVAILVEYLMLERTGLVHCVVVFVENVGHPPVLVIEAERNGVHPVREILEAHSGTIGIRNVVLRRELPSVALPGGAEVLAAALVSEDILPVRLRAVSTRRPSEHHTDIVFKTFRKGSVLRALPSPDGIMVQKKVKGEAFRRLQGEAYARAVNERPLDIPDIGRLVVAVRP